MINLSTLPADPHDNQLGVYLRKLWDAARSAGQTHGVWKPELGRFVTMDELTNMEATP